MTLETVTFLKDCDIFKDDDELRDCDIFFGTVMLCDVTNRYDAKIDYDLLSYCDI